MPTFPQSSMIGSLGDLARELGRDNEVPEEFLFADALTVAGTIMSGRFTLSIGLESDTRLYTVTVGDSADTKKTTAQRKITKFFTAMNLPEWSMCHGVGSAEGLAKSLNNCSRVVLAIDELKQLLQKTQIRGSVLLPMITSLYERTDYENQTKDSAISLDDGRLSMMANSTIDTFEGLWDHEALAIGLVNRLWLVTNDPKARVAIPKPVNMEALQVISDRIKAQLSIPPPAPYIFTKEATEIWSKWYYGLSKSETAKRLDGIGFRLMPILVATTDKAQVDEEIANAVVALLDYELDVRRELQPIDADNALAKMEQKIVRILESRGPFDRRGLARYTHAHKAGEWVFRTALQNMKQSGIILLDTKTGKYHLTVEGPDSEVEAGQSTIQ